MSPTRASLLAATRTRIERVNARLTGLVGHGLPISLGLILVVSLVAGRAGVRVPQFGAAHHADDGERARGSAFRQVAEQYRKILAREGVHAEDRGVAGLARQPRAADRSAKPGRRRLRRRRRDGGRRRAAAGVAGQRVVPAADDLLPRPARSTLLSEFKGRGWTSAWRAAARRRCRRSCSRPTASSRATARRSATRRPRRRSRRCSTATSTRCSR